MRRDKWKIGFLASLDFESWDAERVVNVLADLGYQTIEWTTAHFNPNKTNEDLQKLVLVTKKRGLEISEISANLIKDTITLNESLRRQRIQFVRDVMMAASSVGVNMISLFSGPAPWDPEAARIPRDISEGQAWSLLLEAFNQFAECAERCGVYVSVEAVFGNLCRDYYTTKELLDNVDSKYICINMDPSHYELAKNDVPWVVRKWGNKVKHVHLKDVAGKPGKENEDFIFPMVGEGTVDWNGFFKALEDIGYSGSLSVEFESYGYYRKVLKNDPAKAAQISMEQLRNVIAEY